MPLSDFCNRLTNTCTQHGPSDSRACAAPGEPLAGPALGCDTDPPSVVGPPADPRVERRLTATLQLRPSPTTVRRARAEPELRALASKRAPRGPGGASIGSSSAPCLPVAAFSAANRARDVASGALRRDPRDTATAPSEERAEDCVRRAARSASPAASSKAADLAGPGRLPSTMDPSSGSRPFRTASLPSVPAGSPPHARGDSPRTPRRCRREQATTPLHPFARSKSPSARGRTAPEGCPPVREAWGLDPCPKAWTRRRSSISATRTAREHNR